MGRNKNTAQKRSLSKEDPLAWKISPSMLFADWNEYWLSLVQYRLRITSLKRYQEGVRSVINPAFENRRLNEIDEFEAQLFFNSLKEKGIGSSRQSDLLAIARQSLDYAFNRKLIVYNPFSLVQIPRRIRKKTAILYDDDVRNMVKQFPDHPLMPLFITMLMCGLRIGEALGLTWDKIDMGEGIMEVSRQLISYNEEGHLVYKIVPYTKNGEKRMLCIPNLVKRYLEIQMENQRNLPNPYNLVFTTASGDFIKYNHVSYQFGKVMKAIGREDVTLHSLRHTAATTVLYTTGDIATQQRFLGHRSQMTTAGYGDVTMQAMRNFADSIDAAFAEICAEGLGIKISREMLERIESIRSRDLGWEETML